MTKFSKAYAVLLLGIIILTSSGKIVLAQDKYTLLEPLPCLQGSTDCVSGNQIEQIGFKDYVQYLFNFFIAVSAVAAVFMIVWGGFQYMTSDSWTGKSEGLGKLRGAVLGLILVLSSFIILRTIDPRLVDIPTTLVRPLDIKYSKNPWGDLFGQLQTDADKDLAHNKELQDQIQKLSSSVTDLESQKKDIETKLKEARDKDDYDSIDALESELSSVQSRISRTRSDEQLVTGQAALDLAAQSYDPAKGTKGQNAAATIAAMKKGYSDLRDRLTGTGADPDQIRSLDDREAYSEAVIKLNEQVARINDIQLKYFKEQTAVSRLIGSVTDSATKTIYALPVLSTISVANWLTYSPAEYKRDMEAAKSQVIRQMAGIMDTYDDKISNPEVRDGLLTKANDKLKYIQNINY